MCTNSRAFKLAMHTSKSAFHVVFDDLRYRRPLEIILYTISQVCEYIRHRRYYNVVGHDLRYRRLAYDVVGRIYDVVGIIYDVVGIL